MSKNKIAGFIGLGSFILGVLCFIIKICIGSNIGEDGTLEEAFYLLPIGYLFIFTSIVILLVVGIISLVKRIKKSK